MKFLSILIFLISSVNLAHGEAKVDDACFTKCSSGCTTQMNGLISEIKTHSATCRGEVTTIKPDAHICASSCSFGCKNVMRGKMQTVEEYFDDCPGGDGNFGRLYCEKSKGSYFVFNSHTKKAVSDGGTHSRCRDSATSHDYNVFCALKGNKYVLANSATGKTIGEDYAHIDQCKDSIRNIMNFKICVKYGNSNYGAFNLIKWKSASTKTYRSDSSCEKDLNLAY